MQAAQVRYYDTPTLSYWVKHNDQFSSLAYAQVVKDNKDCFIECARTCVDFHRLIRWSMFDWGWVIETQQELASGELVKETIITHDGTFGVVTHRERVGANYEEDGPCDRDDRFPISSIVRLKPCCVQSSSLIETSVGA
jgi:hypothetical protein